MRWLRCQEPEREREKEEGEWEGGTGGQAEHKTIWKSLALSLFELDRTRYVNKGERS